MTAVPSANSSLHLRPVLANVPQVLAEMVAVRGKCVAEQLEEAVPGGFGLRAGLLADDVAVPVERAAAQHVDAEIRRRLDADGPQGVAQLRMGDDAGAAPRQLHVGPLEDVGVPAVPPKQESREQRRSSSRR